MPKIKFQRKTVFARIRNPLQKFQVTEEKIEVRFDPLLGTTMRISKPKGLDKTPEDNPLQKFVEQSKPCFFCAGKVENQTPMLPENIHSPGRIQVGEALLFPNLSGFGRYSGVCIFSKEHFIALNSFTEQQISDALKACQIFFQKCAESDNNILYPTVNGNYLLPAGSSILHPHLQPFLDPFPTNYHRTILNAGKNYLQQNQSNYWEDLKNTERNGSRFLFETKSSCWLTPFAPSGFNEINGIIGQEQSFLDLDEEVLRETAWGLKKIFEYYHRINHNSFNLTIFSTPGKQNHQKFNMPCLLRITSRPVFKPYYRNDTTFFEKLHAESMIDRPPEEVAEQFRQLAD